MNLGKKTKALYHFIEQFILENHYAPTYDEMLEGSGLKSKSNIKPYLEKLQHLGLVDYVDGKPRALWLGDGRSRIVRIVKGGSISAGAPIPTIESDNFDRDWLDVSQSQLPKSVKPGELFALQVDGDSMIDASINDGDWVVFAPPRDVRERDTVAAWIKDEGGLTLKEYLREGEDVLLVPANPKYSTKRKHESQVEFQGKVVLVVRQSMNA